MLFKRGAEKMALLWFAFRKLLQHFPVIRRLSFPSSLAIPFKMITEIESDIRTVVLSQYEQNIACTWLIPLKPGRISCEYLAVVIGKLATRQNQTNQFKLFFFPHEKQKAFIKLYL